MEQVNVTIWNEYIHERSGRIAEVYPNGIHGAIAGMLGRDKRYNIRTATLDMPEHGLTDEVLNSTDVLIWWGHCAHAKVSDEVALKVKYSSDDQTAKMYDIIRGSMSWDFGRIFNDSLSSLTWSMFRNAVSGNNTNWASVFESNKNALETKLAAVVEAMK